MTWFPGGRLLATLCLVAAALLAAAGCGYARSDIRYIDGVKSVCSWEDHTIGRDTNLVCYPIIVESEPVTVP